MGLKAAYSTSILGASKIYLVDRVPERPSAANKTLQCTPIDFSSSDAVEQIIEANGGLVDRSVDCVDYQAVDTSGEKEQANIILENMVRVTRAYGGMGMPGLYLPQDPGALDDKSAKGQTMISFGKLFREGMSTARVTEPLCLAFAKVCQTRKAHKTRALSHVRSDQR